jgi:hypothetical protein
MREHIGVSLEAKNALLDTKQAIDIRGNEIFIHFKSDVPNRDRYNSIEKRNYNTKSIKAYPIDKNPSVYTLEKLGIREDIDLLVYTATQDWININKGIKDIDSIVEEISLNIDQKNNENTELYIIKDFKEVNQFSRVYLNIVLGLTRKP